MGANLKAKISLDASGVKAGASSADKSITALFSKIKRKGETVFRGLTKVALVSFGAIASVCVGLSATIKKSFNFETATVQFKSLLGSMNSARLRFMELKKFSGETPFQLPEILQASRLLTVFSGGLLGAAKLLKPIGDAAAVAGRGIDEVAFWVGRAYSMLKGGKPFGEAAMRLREMGVLTARGRSEIEALVAAGAPLEKTFGRLEQELERFSGGMGDLSITGNGLISTMKDNWTIAVATFGEEFKNLAKGGLKLAIEKIQQLVRDGTIQEWADRAKEALAAVVETISLLSKGGESRSQVLQALGEVVRAAFDEAATSAVQILSKALPRLGYALGEYIQKGATGFFQKDADQMVAVQQLKQRGQWEEVTPELRRTASSARRESDLSTLLKAQGARAEIDGIEARNKARLKQFVEETNRASFVAQGQELSASFGSESTLKDAVEKFKIVLNQDGANALGNLERKGKKLSEELERPAGNLEPKQSSGVEGAAVENSAGRTPFSKTVDLIGMDVGEGGGAQALSATQQFSQLRRVGANVLGSGVVRPAVDRDAQIASATERTARATEDLVRGTNRPTPTHPVRVV